MIKKFRITLVNVNFLNLINCTKGALNLKYASCIT